MDPFWKTLSREDLELSVEDFRRELIKARQSETLRDTFAMCALPACLAEGWGADWSDTAKVAYQIADAMLKARKAGD